MRSSLLIPVLTGLAAAIPYDTPAENGLSKRASTPAWCPYVMNWLMCIKLPAGTGPSITPDTVDAFKSNATFSQAANNAITPSTYVRSFQNSDGATSTSNYLGFYELPSYNASACAAKCDGTRRCTAFNLYFERDPSMTTDPNCCPNPASLTRIKCSLWGTNTTPTTAYNKGQKRDSFQVAIAGSNGYNKQMVFSSSSSSTSATSAKSSVASTTTPKTSSSSSIKSSSVASSVASPVAFSVASSVVSSVVSSASSAAAQKNINAASAGSSLGSSVASSVGSSVGASITPSVTASPTLDSGSSDTLSGLAVSSQSASAASDAAAQPVTDPGSPVTASIATSATPCSTPVAVPELTFNLNRTTYSTQTVYMYGGIDQLGDWDPDQAVALSYSQVPGTLNWFVSMNITSGTYFEYKYFIRNPDWSITWPPTANRVYTVPTSCQQEIVVNDAWATTDQTST